MVTLIVAVPMLAASAIRLGRQARPPSADELEQRMVKSYRMDLFEQVIIDGQRMEKLYPGQAGRTTVLSLMGNALFALAEQPGSSFASDYGVAAEYLQRAADSPADMPAAIRDETTLHLAVSYFKMGRREEAVKAFDLLQTKISYPRFRRALLMYARLLAESSPPRVDDAYRLIKVLAENTKVPVEERFQAIEIEAQIASANGDYDRAIKCCNTLIALAPDDLARKKRLFDLGLALHRKKDFADAEKVFRKALDMRVGEPELDAMIYYYLAMAAVVRDTEDKLDEACSLFNKAFDTAPDSEVGAASLVRREACLNEQGDFSAATETFNRCMTAVSAVHFKKNGLMSPEDMQEVWRATRDKYFADRNHEQYLAMVEALWDKGLMKQDQYLYLVARSYEHQGSELESGIPHNAPDDDARRRRAERLFLDAAEGFSRLLSLAPGSSTTRGCKWLAGHCYFKAGKFSTAAVYLKESLDSFEERGFVTQARYELGRSLQAEGHFIEAIRQYDANISDNPRNVFTHFSRLEKGRCLLAIGRFDDAAAVFTEITEGERIKIDPSNNVWRDARFGLAASLHRAGNSEEALYVFKELMDWYPDDVRTAQVAYWFAEAMRRKADEGGPDADSLYRKAAEYYRMVTEKARLRAFRDHIDDVVVRNCYNYIALCHFRLGDYHAAIQKYNDFAERYDNSPEAVYALRQVAVCYGKLGLATEAKSAEKRMLYFLEKYNEANPEDKLSPEVLF